MLLRPQSAGVGLEPQGAGNFAGGIRCEKEAVQIQCRT
jgi:hypothetical protein